MSSDRRARVEATEVIVRRRERRAVDGVSLELREGELLAIVGPNGAGKTTLLKALLGLLPYEGTVRVDGDDLQTLDVEERARRLVYVPQQSRLESGLRVEEVVLQGRFAHRKKGSKEAVEQAMDRAGVTAFRGRPFPSLSLGEQRRVLLARALASEAGTILLDEPDAFLDVGQALDLFALLRALRDDGRSLLLVLHDLDRAHRFSDRVLLLHEGKRVAYGPAADALGSGALGRVFGVEAIPGDAMGFRRIRCEEGAS